MNHIFRNCQPSNTLIILLHGIGDTKESDLLSHISSFLLQHKISSYSYDIFNFSEKHDSIFATTHFSSYTNILDAAIEKYNKKYSNVFVLGHSFGCHIALLTTKQVSGFILVEPSLSPQVMFNNSEQLSKVYASFPSLSATLGRCVAPRILVFASKGGGSVMAELYKDEECIVVKGANHNFDNPIHIKILEERSLEFIKKHTPTSLR